MIALHLPSNRRIWMDNKILEKGLKRLGKVVLSHEQIGRHSANIFLRIQARIISSGKV